MNLRTPMDAVRMLQSRGFTKAEAHEIVSAAGHPMLRDQFAQSALPLADASRTYEEIAAYAYGVADAMLAHRKPREENL